MIQRERQIFTSKEASIIIFFIHFLSNLLRVKWLNVGTVCPHKFEFFYQLTGNKGSYKNPCEKVNIFTFQH